LPEELPELARSEEAGPNRGPWDGVTQYIPPVLPEIVRGGEEVWNYRLFYPTNLKLGAVPAGGGVSRYARNGGVLRTARAAGSPVGNSSHKEPPGVVGDSRFCIVPPVPEGFHEAERGVPILAMIAAHWRVCNGAIIHWCACRMVNDRLKNPVPTRMRL
jgi:hypothetical protein